MKTTLLSNQISSSFRHASWQREGPCVDNRPATRHLAIIDGRKVTSWACRITFGAECSLPSATLDTWLNVDDRTYSTAVIAPTANEARDFLVDLTAGIPCVEIEVFGPQGGVASHSYRGWESAIGHQLLNARPSAKQQTLF